MTDKTNPIRYVVGCISPSPAAIKARVGEWIVTVTCPYCGAPHVHSAAKGPGVNPGFRIAHCRRDRQGYVVTVSTK